MRKKIIIVGAGPVGCYTAQALKVYGYQPLLIEEHSEVGRPVHCTGLIGSKVFTDKRLFKIPSSSIINRINGAVINYDNQSFTIERKDVAYVVDRERFDKELSKGLDILYQNRFMGIEKGPSGFIVETDKDQIAADIVIGADGANSVMRKILNKDASVSYYKGAQIRIKSKPAYKDMVEVFLKNPSFFWIVPESEEVIRVGTISENPYRDLQNFLKEKKIKGSVVERLGGLVAVRVGLNTVRGNIALVGDAACQIKPLTYGGIYFGLKAASILTSCINKNNLRDYDKLWKKELDFEMRIGIKTKEIYNTLRPDELGKIFRMMKRNKALIEKIGDFENHSLLILEILKKPSLYPQMSGLLQMLFKKIL